MTEPLTPEQFDEAMDAVLCGECDNQAHVHAARLIESSHELLRARLAAAEQARQQAEAELAALRAQQDGGDPA